MDVFNITTFSSFLVDIEHEEINYEVRVADTGLSWDYSIRDIDNNEDIEKDHPLYVQLLRAADDAIDTQKKPVTIEDLRRIETLSDPNKMRTPDMLFRELQLINIIAKQLIKNH